MNWKLKKHWSKKLKKLQLINLQNEKFLIGNNHCDIRFRITQLAIKFKI
jgi:ribosomal protein L28